MNNKKIVTSSDYVGFVAHYIDECEGDDHQDYFGRGATPNIAIADLLSNSECEHDCNYECMGCGRNFHNIKVECDLDHTKELIDSHRVSSGNHYCNSDCGKK